LSTKLISSLLENLRHACGRSGQDRGRPRRVEDPPRIDL